MITSTYRQIAAATIGACALAIVALSAGAQAVGNPPITPLSDDHPCAGALEERLQFYGLGLSTMRNPTWQTQSLPTAAGGQSVSGYLFIGQPIGCDAGGLTATLWANCQIVEVYTTGQCRITGLPSQSF